jgi:hypothetical protein
VSVWLREGGRGRAAALREEAASAGEAGGVCVAARGLVLGDRASSRASSEAPPECKCRFLRKLRPRRPAGRGEGEFGERGVAATVGAAGAGAVNITEAAQTGSLRQALRRLCVKGVSTTFDRQRNTDDSFTQPYALQYAEGNSGAACESDCKCTSGDAAKHAGEEY